MMSAGVSLRISLFNLLVVVTHGYQMKGSQSTGQSSGGFGANYAAYQSGSPSLASAPYGPVGALYGPTSGHGPSVYQPVVTASHFSGPGSPVLMGGTGLSAVGGAGVGGAGLSMGGVGLSAVGGPGTAGVGVPGDVGMSGVGLSAVGGPVTAGVGGPDAASFSILPGAAYVSSPVVYEPVEDSVSQGDQPETRWTVPTTVFEGGSADSEYLSDILPPPPPSPQGPTLHSGETSSVVKEAELGNYQQQTEEFGYPADFSEAAPDVGQGLAQVLVPGVQLGGFRPVPSARFDRMLLYGLYPPGSYSTFSQNHEAGKDYSQDLHYLKEHVTESHGTDQQKFFPGSL